MPFVSGGGGSGQGVVYVSWEPDRASYPPRPKSAAMVIFRGPVEPVDHEPQDLWVKVGA